MKIALVYDRVTKWGGAERVLLALHALFPDAPLYTAVYDRKKATWADVFAVHTSFLQHVPGAKRSHEFLAWITPMAFETFNFDAYDVVISVTSAEAKDIITKPGTVHICYCLTPTRYLWSGYEEYRANPGLGMFSAIAKKGLSTLSKYLRAWDMTASSRPDYYVAISQRVAGRIQKYYGRDVHEVIYPPVDTKAFRPGAKDNKGEYFLTVARLVGYKRIDILIDAFNTLGLPLVVIGSGFQKQELKRQAKPNITFVDTHLTQIELVRYYQQCRAFVYAADEDFGIAAVEAQASGKPVIAYKQSALSETVVDGVTGILYNTQDSQAVVGAVRKFLKMKFDGRRIVKHAQQFDTEVFNDKMKRLISALADK